MKLCKALTQAWEPWGPRGNPQPFRTRDFYYLVFMELLKPCVVYNGPRVVHVTKPKIYCKGCDNKYMCLKK
jgi:hypothetical protein